MLPYWTTSSTNSQSYRLPRQLNLCTHSSANAGHDSPPARLPQNHGWLESRLPLSPNQGDWLAENQCVNEEERVRGGKWMRANDVTKFGDLYLIQDK